MSIGNLFSGITSRLSDRRWGTKIADQEGNDRDTGVQVLAEEMANAFAAGGVTEFSEPVRLRYLGQGPAIIIEDGNGNAQALQFLRRSDEGQKVSAVTIGVRAESDGVMANAVLPSPAMTLTQEEQLAYYGRGMPYVHVLPGGPGDTNVGSGGTGGVGYPPRYNKPHGVQLPFASGGTSPCDAAASISGYSGSGRLVLTINDGVCAWASVCDLLKELTDYAASDQVLTHDSGGDCQWSDVGTCDGA